MSASIDERIVQMTFDNGQFEAGAEQSMSTLERLKQALHFDSLSDGFTGTVSKLSSGFASLSGVADSTASGISGFFSRAWEEIKIGFERNIGAELSNKLQNLVTGLSTDQIAEGWSKYESTVESVQQILNNSTNTIEEVEVALEELQWYSDETSYSLSDMQSALASFVSAGQGLDRSVTAIEGIANWAASAGVNARNAAPAFTSLSKAMSTGYVSAREWITLQQVLKMGTQNFKEAVAEAAVAEGTLKKVGEESGKALYDVWNKEKDVWAEKSLTIDELLSQLGTYKWMSSDVLMSVLETYAESTEQVYDYIQAQRELTDEYISVDEAMEACGISTMSFSAKCFLAAQQAKTFTDTLEALKDMISTGWKDTFEGIFGNYEEAAEVWTEVCGILGDAISIIGTFRNAVVDAWHDMNIFNEDGLEGSTDLKNSWIELQQASGDLFQLNDVWSGYMSLMNGWVSSKSELTGFVALWQSVFNILNSVADVLGDIGTGFLEAFNISEGGMAEALTAFTKNLYVVSDWVRYWIENDTIASAITQTSKMIGDAIQIPLKFVNQLVDGLNNLGQTIDGFSNSHETELMRFSLADQYKADLEEFKKTNKGYVEATKQMGVEAAQAIEVGLKTGSISESDLMDKSWWIDKFGITPSTDKELTEWFATFMKRNEETGILEANKEIGDNIDNILKFNWIKKTGNTEDFAIPFRGLLPVVLSVADAINKVGEVWNNFEAAMEEHDTIAKLAQPILDIFKGIGTVCEEVVLPTLMRIFNITADADGVTLGFLDVVQKGLDKFIEFVDNMPPIADTLNKWLSSIGKALDIDFGDKLPLDYLLDQMKAAADKIPTIQEVLESFQEFFQGFMDGFKNSNGFEDIQEMMDSIFGESADLNGDGIINGLEAVKAALENFSSVIKSPIKLIKGAFEELFGTISGEGTTAYDAGSKLGKVLGDAIDLLVSVGDVAWDVVMAGIDLFKTAWNALVEALRPLLGDEMANGLSIESTGGIQNATETISALGNLLSGFFESINLFIQALCGGMGKGASLEELQAAADESTQLVVKVGNALGQILGAIAPLVRAIVDLGEAGLEEAADIINGQDSPLEAIGDFFDKVTSSLLPTMKSIWDKMTSTFGWTTGMSTEAQVRQVEAATQACVTMMSCYTDSANQMISAMPLSSGGDVFLDEGISMADAERLWGPANTASGMMTQGVQAARTVGDAAKEVLRSGVTGVETLIHAAFEIITTVLTDCVYAIANVYAALSSTGLTKVATAAYFAYEFNNIVTIIKTISSGFNNLTKPLADFAGLMTPIKGALGAFSKAEKADAFESYTEGFKNIAKIVATLTILAGILSFFDVDKIAEGAGVMLACAGVFTLVAMGLYKLAQKKILLDEAAKNTADAFQVNIMSNNKFGDIGIQFKSLGTAINNMAKAMKTEAIADAIGAIAGAIAVIATAIAVFGAMMYACPGIEKDLLKGAAFVGGLLLALGVFVIIVEKTAKTLDWKAAPSLIAMSALLIVMAGVIGVLAVGVIAVAAAIMLLSKIPGMTGTLIATFAAFAVMMVGLVVGIKVISAAASKLDVGDAGRIAALAAVMVGLSVAILIICEALIGLATAIKLTGGDNFIGAFAAFVTTFVLIVAAMMLLIHSADQLHAGDAAQIAIIGAVAAAIGIVAAVIVKILGSATVNWGAFAMFSLLLVELGLIVAGMVVLGKIASGSEIMKVTEAMGVALLAVIALAAVTALLCSIKPDEAALKGVLQVLGILTAIFAGMAVISAVLAALDATFLMGLGSGAFEAIAQGMMELGVVLIEISGAFLVLAAAIKVLSSADAENLKNVWDAIRDGKDILITVALGFVAAVAILSGKIPAITNVFEGIGDRLKSVFGKVGDKISSGSSKVFSTLLKVAAILAIGVAIIAAVFKDYNGDDIRAWFDKFKTTLKVVCEEMIPVIEQVTEFIIKAIGSMIEGLAEAAPALGNSLGDAIRGVFKGLGHALTLGLIDGASEVEKAQDNFDKTIESWKNASTKAAKSIGDVWMNENGELVKQIGPAIDDTDTLGKLYTESGEVNWEVAFKGGMDMATAIALGYEAGVEAGDSAVDAGAARAEQHTTAKVEEASSGIGEKLSGLFNDLLGDIVPSSEDLSSGVASFTEGIQNAFGEAFNNINVDSLMGGISDFFSGEGGLDWSMFGIDADSMDLGDLSIEGTLNTVLTGGTVTMPDGSTLDMNNLTTGFGNYLGDMTNAQGETIDLQTAINLVSTGETITYNGTEYSDAGAFASAISAQLEGETPEVNTEVVTLLDTTDPEADVQNLLSFEGAYQSAGETLGTALLTGFSSTGATNGAATGTNAGNTIAAGVRAAYSTMHSAGIFLAQGAIAGLNSMHGELYDAGAKAGEQMSQGFEDNNQIKSPSRRWMQDGDYLAQGAIIGIKSMYGSLYDTGSEAGDQVSGGFENAVHKLDMEDAFSISPVLDLDNIQNGVEQIKTIMDKSALTAAAAQYTATIAGKQISMKSLINNGLLKVSGGLNGVAQGNAALAEEFYTLRDAVEGMTVTLDSGRLVGGIVGKMDSSLAKRNAIRARGG